MPEYINEDLDLRDLTSMCIFTKPQALKLKKLVTFLYANDFIHEHQFKALSVYIDVILDMSYRNEAETIRDERQLKIYRSSCWHISDMFNSMMGRRDN